MWARIENNTVVEIKDRPAGLFHPSLVWVECPDYVQPGYIYDREVFTPPTV